MSAENYLKLQFIAISAKLKFQKSQKQFPTTRNSRIHIRIKGFQTVLTMLNGSSSKIFAPLKKKANLALFSLTFGMNSLVLFFVV